MRRRQHWKIVPEMLTPCACEGGGGGCEFTYLHSISTTSCYSLYTYKREREKERQRGRGERRTRFRSRMTRPERIPDVSPRARANGVVVEDAALGLHAARAGARVHAALVDAGTSWHAVGVGDALGRATELWAAVKAGEAGASALPSHHLALGVGTTRGGAGGRGREGGRLQAGV